jgi:mRNA-degrading endonuclease toxin of MazEF toxin-antitoxin module
VTAPREGDLVELDFGDGSRGHEHFGRRPALVVSVDAFHAFGMALVCPVTTHGGRKRPSPGGIEVPIPRGLKVAGWVLPHHVRAVDWNARKSVTLEVAPRATLMAVRARVRALLGA